jgi:hypothetical protein
MELREDSKKTLGEVEFTEGETSTSLSLWPWLFYLEHVLAFPRSPN